MFQGEIRSNIQYEILIQPIIQLDKIWTLI